MLEIYTLSTYTYIPIVIVSFVVFSNNTGAISSLVRVRVSAPVLVVGAIDHFFTSGNGSFRSNRLSSVTVTAVVPYVQVFSEVARDRLGIRDAYSIASSSAQSAVGCSAKIFSAYRFDGFDIDLLTYFTTKSMG